MKTPNHLISFLLLGMFWAVSPSVYKHLADIGMPVSHTVAISGLVVGILMLAIVLARSGAGSIDKRVVAYGFGCAVLINVPFSINLVLAAYVPPTELSIIITLSPFFAFLVSSVMRHEKPSGRRLAAICFGFTSTLVLILSREGTISGRISWPLVAALLIPLLYSFYNTFAARAWPKGADTIQAGAFESLWSGLIAIPFLMWFAPFSSPATPALGNYWALGLLCLIWVVERLVYFSLITERGAVYTVQATYVSTPAAVIIASVFFGGATDYWLWVSLALLMMALYLNNSGSASRLKMA